MRFSLAAIALQLVFSTTVWGWGDVGHGAVGYIAQQNLSKRGKSFVQALMGAEPLATSAIFPDHVRSDSRFNAFSDFHFFEIPDGSSFETLPPAARAAVRDADTLISQAPRQLTAFRLTRLQKQVLFRYFVHIVGDVHMPLHIGNGVDRGANLCDVKWLDPHLNRVVTVNLHKIWDEGLIENIQDDFRKIPGNERKWFGYRELAEIIMNENKDTAAPAHLSVDQRGQWYADSRALHSAVYPGSVVSPAARTYCKMVDPTTKAVVNGAYDAATIPMLDQAYVNRSIPVVKRQIYLAGLRLAAAINKMAEDQYLSETRDEQDQQFLAPLLLSNRPGQ